MHKRTERILTDPEFLIGQSVTRNLTQEAPADVDLLAHWESLEAQPEWNRNAVRKLLLGAEGAD